MSYFSNLTFDGYADNQIPRLNIPIVKSAINTPVVQGYSDCMVRAKIIVINKNIFGENKWYKYMIKSREW